MSLMQNVLRFFRLSPSPTDDFYYGPVRRNAAGVDVDEQTALTYSACWAATLLLTSGAMLPLKLMRKLAGGGSEVADDDPRHALVHDAPNSEMGPMMFRSSRINHQVNRGNGFAEIEWSAGGVPLNLWPIDPTRIPKENIRRDYSGRLVYLVNNNDGTKTPLEAREVLHFASPMSNDGIVGLGVIENARLSVGFGIATETQGASYMANGGRPTMTIEGIQFKNKEERDQFRREWAEVHGSPQNNGRPAIVPKDVKVTSLSWSAEDSQFLQTRQHNIEEIARWYGVPQHMIGHLLRSTNNNIEQQSLEFVTYSLMRWLVLWEQELNRKLLTPEERKTLYFKHNVDALLRGDLNTRTQALHQQFFDGSLTLNQWCAIEDRNPIGPLGDINWTQQAMVPLEIAAKGPQPAAAPAATEEPDEPEETPAEEPPAEETPDLSAELKELAARQKAIAEAMLRDVMARMVSLEVNAVKRVAEKPSRFDVRLREFYDKHAQTMRRELLGPFKAAYNGSHAECLEHVVTTHIAESLRQLDALCDTSTGETLSANVENCVAKWHDERTHLNA